MSVTFAKMSVVSEYTFNNVASVAAPLGNAEDNTSICNCPFVSVLIA